MISRHLLRIKILQILFAHYRNGENSLEKLNKELNLSVQKAYHLYHLLLWLPVELADYAQTRIDVGLQKLLPTAEDKNPNTRFVNNPVVKKLEACAELRNYLDTNRLNWRNRPDLIKNLFNHLRQTDEYREYMEKPAPTDDDHRLVLANFIQKELPENVEFEQFMEEESIYWNDDLDLVAGMAAKTIKRIGCAADDQVLVMPMYRNPDDEHFARTLLKQVVLRHTENLALINQYTENWEVDRIANMDILLMEMAITEILEFTSVPIKVSLNEYIEIVKFYSTEKSGTFINGVLDKAITSLRSQNLIQKEGRGLVGDDDIRLNQ